MDDDFFSEGESEGESEGYSEEEDDSWDGIPECRRCGWVYSQCHCQFWWHAHVACALADAACSAEICGAAKKASWLVRPVSLLSYLEF